MQYLVKIIDNYNVKLINIMNTRNSLLNERVKKIFVINLLEDTSKRNYIITLMSKLQLNFTLVIVDRISNEIYHTLCIDQKISKEELGCCLSHLYCLRKIIENNYENAIIFEDDIIFHKNFINEFMKIDLEMCDFLLLGAHDYNFASLNYLYVKENGLYHPNENSIHLYGAHANYYSLQGAKCMFEIRISQISFFDKEYMLLFNYFTDTSFICYPNLVVSDISKSHLNHGKPFLTNEEIEYYTNCFIEFDFQQYHFIYLDIFTPFYISNDGNVSLLSLKNTSNIGVSNEPQETQENECDYQDYLSMHLHKKYIHLNIEEIQLIKNRFTLDFFTIKDITSFQI